MTFFAIVPSAVFAIFFGKKMRAIQREIQTQKAVMTTVAEESFQNVRTVKAFANEDDEARKFREGNIKVFKMGRTKAIYSGIYSSLVQVFLYGAMAGVIYTAKELFKKGLVTPGSITTFLFYSFQLIFSW